MNAKRGDDLFNFLEGMEFGQRLFSYGKWYIQIKHLRDNLYLVVEPDAIMPTNVFLTHQSAKAKKYQEILFRKFDKKGILMKKLTEKLNDYYKL